MLSNTEAELKKGIAYSSLKKSVDIHFNKSEIFFCRFLTMHMTSICQEKNVRQKHGLFMQNKCLPSRHLPAQS